MDTSKLNLYQTHIKLKKLLGKTFNFTDLHYITDKNDKSSFLYILYSIIYTDNTKNHINTIKKDMKVKNLSELDDKNIKKKTYKITAKQLKKLQYDLIVVGEKELENGIKYNLLYKPTKIKEDISYILLLKKHDNIHYLLNNENGQGFKKQEIVGGDPLNELLNLKISTINDLNKLTNKTKEYRNRIIIDETTQIYRMLNNVNIEGIIMPNIRTQYKADQNKQKLIFQLIIKINDIKTSYDEILKNYKELNDLARRDIENLIQHAEVKLEKLYTVQPTQPRPKKLAKPHLTTRFIHMQPTQPMPTTQLQKPHLTTGFIHGQSLPLAWTQHRSSVRPSSAPQPVALKQRRLSAVLSRPISAASASMRLKPSTQHQSPEIKQWTQQQQTQNQHFASTKPNNPRLTESLLETHSSALPQNNGERTPSATSSSATILHETQAGFEACQTENAKLKQNLAKLETERNTLKNQNEQLKDVQTKLAQTKNDNEALQTKLTACDNDLKNCRQENATLKQNLENLKTEIYTLKIQNANLEQVSKENDALKVQLDACRAELDSEKNNLATRVQEIDKLQEQLKSMKELSKEVERFKTNATTYEKKVKVLEEIRINLEQKVEELQQQINNTKSAQSAVIRSVSNVTAAALTAVATKAATDEAATQTPPERSQFSRDERGYNANNNGSSNRSYNTNRSSNTNNQQLSNVPSNTTSFHSCREQENCWEILKKLVDVTNKYFNSSNNNALSDVSNDALVNKANHIINYITNIDSHQQSNLLQVTCCKLLKELFNKIQEIKKEHTNIFDSQINNLTNDNNSIDFFNKNYNRAIIILEQLKNNCLILPSSPRSSQHLHMSQQAPVFSNPSKLKFEAQLPIEQKIDEILKLLKQQNSDDTEEVSYAEEVQQIIAILKELKQHKEQIPQLFRAHIDSVMTTLKGELERYTQQHNTAFQQMKTGMHRVLGPHLSSINEINKQLVEINKFIISLTEKQKQQIEIQNNQFNTLNQQLRSSTDKQHEILQEIQQLKKQQETLLEPDLLVQFKQITDNINSRISKLNALPTDLAQALQEEIAKIIPSAPPEDNLKTFANIIISLMNDFATRFAATNNDKKTNFISTYFEYITQQINLSAVLNDSIKKSIADSIWAVIKLFADQLEIANNYAAAQAQAQMITVQDVDKDGKPVLGPNGNPQQKQIALKEAEQALATHQTEINKLMIYKNYYNSQQAARASRQNGKGGKNGNEGKKDEGAKGKEEDSSYGIVLPVTIITAGVAGLALMMK